MADKLIYIHYEDGTKAPYASADDAMAQASHDAKYGFGVPMHIADEDGSNVIHDQKAIRKVADKL
jgi:hypothetical protein